MNRLFASICCVSLFAGSLRAAPPPNILVILADDCTYNDLPVYGGENAHTLVLFSSEQGSQSPGNKWTNWSTGLHTALIARWPSMPRRRAITAFTRPRSRSSDLDHEPTRSGLILTPAEKKPNAAEVTKEILSHS